MKSRISRTSAHLFILIILLFLQDAAFGQAGFEDDRVMLQGFYWESYRHGHPDRFPDYGDKRWYEIVKEQAPAMREGRFDLIWLPPPSYAGEFSAGYNPKEYFNLENSYGNFQQHRAMLEALLQNGIEPVADIVINHRDGTAHWADFKNPDWGTGLREKIKALINARKVAGVHAGSTLNTQNNAQAKGVYAARIVGRHGALYVRIGGSDMDWQPRDSGYSGYREYAQGSGWKVWVGLPGNPPVQQAPLKAAMTVADYQDPADIVVTDAWLN
jgi:hypothetical protein